MQDRLTTVAKQVAMALGAAFKAQLLRVCKPCVQGGRVLNPLALHAVLRRAAPSPKQLLLSLVLLHTQAREAGLGLLDQSVANAAGAHLWCLLQEVTCCDVVLDPGMVDTPLAAPGDLELRIAAVTGLTAAQVRRRVLPLAPLVPHPVQGYSLACSLDAVLAMPLVAQLCHEVSHHAVKALPIGLAAVLDTRARIMGAYRLAYSQGVTPAALLAFINPKLPVANQNPAQLGTLINTAMFLLAGLQTLDDRTARGIPMWPSEHVRSLFSQRQQPIPLLDYCDAWRVVGSSDVADDFVDRTGALCAFIDSRSKGFGLSVMERNAAAAQQAAAAISKAAPAPAPAPAPGPTSTATLLYKTPLTDLVAPSSHVLCILTCQPRSKVPDFLAMHDSHARAVQAAWLDRCDTDMKAGTLVPMTAPQLDVWRAMVVEGAHVGSHVNRMTLAALALVQHVRVLTALKDGNEAAGDGGDHADGEDARPAVGPACISCTRAVGRECVPTCNNEAHALCRTCLIHKVVSHTRDLLGVSAPTVALTSVDRFYGCAEAKCGGMYTLRVPEVELPPAVLEACVQQRPEAQGTTQKRLSHGRGKPAGCKAAATLPLGAPALCCDTCGSWHMGTPKAGVARCQVCVRQTCVRCRGSKHPGILCPALWPMKPEELLNMVKSQPCPSCQKPTTKERHCNHMQCAVCRQHWCWECGQGMTRLEDHYADFDGDSDEDAGAAAGQPRRRCGLQGYSVGTETARMRQALQTKLAQAKASNDFGMQECIQSALQLLGTTAAQSDADL
jgi:hypothetical protein